MANILLQPGWMKPNEYLDQPPTNWYNTLYHPGRKLKKPRPHLLHVLLQRIPSKVILLLKNAAEPQVPKQIPVAEKRSMVQNIGLTARNVRAVPSKTSKVVEKKTTPKDSVAS